MSRKHHHVAACSCSRRGFLRGGGLALTGFGIASVFPTPLIRHAMAGVPTGKRLLFVFLRGGNDGLNAVIPHGDPDYNATTRPTLYIAPSEAVDLNGFASLHPALADLGDVYDAGQLAVLHRVGYANNSRSHFDGQRIWENGDPAQSQLFEGWLYRYVKEHALDAGVDLPVLTAQATPPLLVSGEEKFVNIASPGSFSYAVGEPLKSKLGDGWRAVYEGLTGLEPYRPVLSQTGVKLVDSLDEFESWDQASWNPVDPDTGWSLFPVDDTTNPPDPDGPNGLKFPASAYGWFASLKIAVLALLESDGGMNGTRVAGTQLGGWDHHDNQGTMAGQHPTLLAQLAYGIRSTRIALSGAAIDDRGYADIWGDTVVCTLSEFGRTSRENGNGGTDHAAASCQFLAGGGVAGGVYNCDSGSWPAGVMFGQEGRYLLEATDYRAVFWEILRDHMGADPATLETVFPGYGAAGLGAQELGFLV